jgi:hypothetical protein
MESLRLNSGLAAFDLIEKIRSVRRLFSAKHAVNQLTVPLLSCPVAKILWTLSGTATAV